MGVVDAGDAEAPVGVASGSVVEAVDGVDDAGGVVDDGRALGGQFNSIKKGPILLTSVAFPPAQAEQGKRLHPITKSQTLVLHTKEENRRRRR